MALDALFLQNKHAQLQTSNKQYDTSKKIKDNIKNLWIKCPSCRNLWYIKDIYNNFMCCKQCGYHLRIDAKTRLKYTVDKDSFEEWDTNLTSSNPINFDKYEQKIELLMNKTGLKEAVVTGKARISGFETVICVMDANFMMGSMGSVVGEKITRAFEKAIELKLPVVIFCASGGARMQEGIYSLMQMAKVSAAVARHSEAGLLYISVLTDPTTGGVTASFAMLGDIIISEKGALIGFAGKRVIEQTIKQCLPDDFQKAEFLLKRGFVDMVVDRRQIKQVLSDIFMLHKCKRCEI